MSRRVEERWSVYRKTSLYNEREREGEREREREREKKTIGLVLVQCSMVSLKQIEATHTIVGLFLGHRKKKICD